MTADVRETVTSANSTRAFDRANKLPRVYDGIFAFAGNYAVALKYVGKLRESYERAVNERDLRIGFVEYAVDSVWLWEEMMHEDKNVCVWLFSNKGVMAFELYAAGIMLPMDITVVQAIGSGCEFAIGAWAAGKKPQECINIASQYDTATSPQSNSVKVFGYVN